MKLTQVVCDPAIFVSLEPDELGLRLLPWIDQFPGGNRQLAWAIREIHESYPGREYAAADVAVREALSKYRCPIASCLASGHATPQMQARSNCTNPLGWAY